MKYVAEIDLPEGAVAETHVMAVAYFDGDGQMKYGFQFSGGTSLAMVLGLLDLLKDDAKRGARED